VEVILELAGFAKKKPVNLYASSAVTKLEKTGFPKLTKKTITDFVDGGIQPAYLTKPFYVAWKHLSDR
jgi:hypothetical protein